MRRKRSSRRISTIIVSYFSLFIAAILIVMSIFSYYYSYDNMRKRSIEDTGVVLTQVGKNIGRYIANARDIAGIIGVNTDLQRYLKDDGAGGVVDRSSFRSFLDSIPRLGDGILSIFIFNNDNRVVYLPEGLHMKEGYDITQEDWYRKVADKQDAQPGLTGTQVRVMTEKENPWVISLSARITGEDGEVLGTQLVELNYRVIDDILRDINLGSKGYVFLVDSAGNIVYHPQLQLIYSGLKRENIDAILQTGSGILDLPEENKLYNISNVPDTDFSIVGVTFRDELVEAGREMVALYVILTLILALAAFLGSFQMARYVTRPLSKLESAVNEVEKGNWNVNFDIAGTHETEKFAGSLKAMTDTVKQLMEQVVEDQETIRTSELKALQSQINPHFLYNTLDSIVWIAEEDGNAEIKKITMALANYFRIVLSSGKDIISVREETEHVKNYLVIQKMRYENMDYRIEVEDSVLDLNMPKLLLQPIVENAIYHGIKNNADGGTIWVRGYRRDNELFFEIEDNGRGMRPIELRNIFKATKRKVKQGGVALRNIKERIELYYGDEYGISVESEFRKGTKVTVCLPVRGEERYEQ